MTAQLRNNETLQKRTANPDFMVRWLNGDLTEMEIASLRNRKEYEEMIANSHKDGTLSFEKKTGQIIPISPKKENETVAKKANTNAFVIFAAIVIVAVLAALFFMKNSGWL